MTPQEFAASIKAKYPQYASIDDNELTQRMLSKYPQYQSVVQADVAAGARANLAKIQSGGDIPPGVNLQNSSVPQEFMNTPSGAAMQIPADLTTGAAQGAASTVYNLGKLAHHLPGMNAIAPDTAGAFSGGPPAALQPTTTAGKIGKVGEQMAEFMVPGQAEAGALAPVAKVLSKMGLLGDMATNAAIGGGVSAAQGGSPVAGAIAGGVAPAIQAGAANLAPRIINSAIGATKGAFKTGANPGEGVVDAGIVSPTLKKMLDQVGSAQDAIGQRIGNVLQRISQGNAIKLDLTDAVEKPIAEAASGLKILGGKAEAGSLNDMKQGIVDHLQEKFGSNLDNVTPAQAFDVRLEIKKSIKSWASDPALTSKAGIAKQIWRNIGSEISDAYPAIKPLNEKYANLAEAWDAISGKIADKARSIPGVGALSWRNAFLAATGAGTGHPLAGVGAVLAKEGVGTAPGATATAQGLRGLAAIPPEVAPALASQATQDDRR